LSPDLKIPTHHISSLTPKDEAWEPVASLISRLHRLEELDFVLEENSFPSTLLKAVSQYHPGCQVNIWPCQGVEYSAPGIEQAKYPFTGALEFDYNTLNFQGLKTLGIEITMDGTSEANIANQAWRDEMLPFILMRPSLKNLLVQASPYGTLSRRSVMSKAKRRWADLAAAVNPVPACSLESISLFGKLCILPRLATVVDLSSVRSLEIQVVQSSDVLEQAASVLNNLERLFLTVWQHVQNCGSRGIRDRLVTAIRVFLHSNAYPYVASSTLSTSRKS
jgi:hypothetical protein